MSLWAGPSEAGVGTVRLTRGRLGCGAGFGPWGLAQRAQRTQPRTRPLLTPPILPWSL